MLENDQLKKDIDDFVNNYSKECNKAPKTVENIKGTLYPFQTWLGAQPFSLTTLCKYVVFSTDQGLAPSTVYARIQILRAFVNFLFTRGYISENFAAKIPKPIVPEKPFDLVAPELLEQAILSGTEPGKGDNARNKRIKQDTRLALLFILRTGLRVGESLKLSGKDLNLTDNPPSYWVDGKGRRKALMPLPIDMIPILISRAQNQRLFITTEKTCNIALKRGCKKTGIYAKVTCHTLRHMFATYRLRSYTPLQVVRRLLRHSDIKITDEIYSHYIVDDLAVALNSQAIIRGGLSAPEIFDMVTAAIKQTGIYNDRRFQINIINDDKKISIVIEQVE